MQDNNNWREHAATVTTLIDTKRRLTPLSKYPKDLDFTKTISNTTYVVKSHFNPNINESILRTVLRLMDNDTNI